MKRELKPTSFGRILLGGVLGYIVVQQTSAGWKFLLLCLLAMFVSMLVYWQLKTYDSNIDRR